MLLLSVFLTEYCEFQGIIQEKDAEQFINMAKNITDTAAKENIDAVLQVSTNVNKSLYDRLKEAKPEMCQALMELMKDEVAEVVRKATAEKDAVIADKDAKLADKDAKLADKDAEIARLKAALAAKG